MKIEEAIKAMNVGKTIRWANSLRRFTVEGIYIKDQNGEEFDISNIDMLSTDNWEIVEEKKTLSDKSIRGFGVGCVGQNTYYEKDVKKSIKEFIHYIINPDKIDFRKQDVRNKAKEIFGDKLI